MSDPVPAAAPAPQPPYTPPAFHNVRYRGNPPKPFNTWADWQKSNPLSDVTICANYFVEAIGTNCCALAHMLAHDDTSVLSMRRSIKMLTAQGYRAIFVISKLHERELVKRLKLLKFKPITRFSRRTCYDRTLLTMWIKRI